MLLLFVNVRAVNYILHSLQACPRWSDWSEWTACSHPCGQGSRSHTRECIFGVKGQDGCLGEKQEYEPCNVEVSVAGSLI